MASQMRARRSRYPRRGCRGHLRFRRHRKDRALQFTPLRVEDAFIERSAHRALPLLRAWRHACWCQSQRSRSQGGRKAADDLGGDITGAGSTFTAPFGRSTRSATQRPFSLDLGNRPSCRSRPAYFALAQGLRAVLERRENRGGVGDVEVKLSRHALGADLHLAFGRIGYVVAEARADVRQDH